MESRGGESLFAGAVFLPGTPPGGWLGEVICFL